MIVQDAPNGGLHPDLDTTRPAHRAFNQWLQVQLKARKLTQRQLGKKSGVDHSTISRLTRGERIPSLRTATMLVRALGMAHDLGGLAELGLGSITHPMARVEYALRSDDSLTEARVREIMNVYVAARLPRPPSAPPPTVVEVHAHPRVRRS